MTAAPTALEQVMARHRGLLGTIAVGALVLAACARPSDVPTAGPSPTPRPLVPEDEIVRVLSPDSIPSIDEPAFVSPEDATWLGDREPVVSLEIDGDARAYPVQILTWHEIVNDEVGGVPVAVTYCPLCNSALVFDRRADGEVLEFGTSGSLYRSALVMYDRSTDSLWTHFDGRSIQGPLTGTELELVPAQMLSFAQWRDEHPRGRVLSRDTGFGRSYGQNPYDFYDSEDGPRSSFFDGQVDPRLPAMSRVVGVVVGDDALAVPFDRLRSGSGAGVAHERVGSRDVVVFWKAGAASALDTPEIAEGRDVGATGVFVPRARTRMLTFEARKGEIVDRETGSVWTLGGRAERGPMAGERLEALPHLDAFWFAWAAYHPDTVVAG